jgi:hypothetical protein
MKPSRENAKQRTANFGRQIEIMAVILLQRWRIIHPLDWDAAFWRVKTPHAELASP